MRREKFRTLALTAATAAAFSFAGPASAAFVVDGDLSSDWGIVVSDWVLASQGARAHQNIGSTWHSGLTNTANINGTPFTTSQQYFAPGAGGGLAHAFLEDTNDLWNSGNLLEPEAGGQDYDAEFMGVAFDDTNKVVYIAVVSGQRPDNGLSTFSPGDIIIKSTTPLTTYAVEVGGGTGNSAINQGAIGHNNPTNGLATSPTALGSTYNLTTSGNTGSVTDLPGRLAGTVWKNPGLLMETVGSGVSFPQIDTNGTSAGDALSYIYTRDDLQDQHTIIELALSYASLGAGVSANADFFNNWSFSWAPACENDAAGMQVFIDPAITDTPEPTSMLLTGLGALGFIGVRRRMRTKVAA